MTEGSAKVLEAGGDPWLRRSRRTERFELREWLWSVTSQARIRACGRTRISVEAGVKVVVSADKVAHYSGIQTCASIHVCPVCMPKIRAERAFEIETAAMAHLATGGSLLFLTNTMPHGWGERLSVLLDVIVGAHKSVISGRQWIEDKADYGIIGQIRSLEVTVGINGWHPHLHSLLFLDRHLSDDELRHLETRLHSRWVRSVVRAGHKAPSDEHGTRLLRVERPQDLAQYLAKVVDENGKGRAVGNELARHDMKKGRRAGRSPLQLLEDTKTGDADDLALWWEYEAAMKGRRAITWSRGLKAMYGIGEQSDEEIAEAEVPGEIVCNITNGSWKVLRARKGALAVLLTVAELHGEAGCYEYLELLAERDEGRPRWTPLEVLLRIQSDPIVQR